LADAGEKVYDLLNCGPRNRFCTPWAVAHNCLGLTYGQWGKGFQAYAKTFGIELTLDEANAQVRQFRSANPKLVKFWERLEQGFRMSRGDVFEVELPSGRKMRYFDVAVSRTTKGYDYRARPVRGEASTYYSQGKWHNNTCQGTARDVLGEAVLRIEYELGLPVVLTVHDEVLVEVDEADAEDAKREISRVMATPPPWLPGIPLASDCFISDRYEK
jgi:DNA polymerase